MSDAGTLHKRLAGNPAGVNRDLFLTACAAKGCRTDDETAALLGVTRAQVMGWRRGYRRPRLPRAQQIASTLGVDINDLWPAA